MSYRLRTCKSHWTVGHETAVFVEDISRAGSPAAADVVHCGDGEWLCTDTQQIPDSQVGSIVILRVCRPETDVQWALWEVVKDEERDTESSAG